MKTSVRQRDVDNLISHFWKNGYLTLSRKFGTYLPEPNNVGKYEVDAIAKQSKRYAIGVILKDEELNDPHIFQKLEYLATRHTKYSHRKVTLFLGVHKEHVNKVRLCIKNLPEDAQKNIKIITLRNDDSPDLFSSLKK